MDIDPNKVKRIIDKVISLQEENSVLLTALDHLRCRSNCGFCIACVAMDEVDKIRAKDTTLSF